MRLMRALAFAMLCCFAIAAQRSPAATADPPASASASPSPSQQAFEQALAEVRAGRPQSALAILEPLRGQASTEPPVLALLGAVYLESGRPQDALAVLEPLASSQAADPAVLYNAARAAKASGQEEKALAWLARSAALAPVSPAARELGLAHGREGQWEDAYRLLRPWAKAVAGDVEGRQAAAFAAVRLGRPAEARDLLAGLPPDPPPRRVLEAEICFAEGDPNAALAALEPLLRVPPPGLAREVRRLAADANLSTGRAAEAVAQLAGHTGGDAALALLLAQAQFQTGEVEAALATLEPFVPRDASHAGAGPSLDLEYGRMLVAAGRATEAIDIVRRGLARLPEDRQGWQTLAQALLAAGRRDEGQQALERFRALAAAEASAAERKRELEATARDATAAGLERAMAALAAGRPEDALALARREASLVADDPRPPLVAGHVLLTLGRYQEALAATEASLRLAPDQPDALYQHGVAALGSGDVARAESDLRRALELAPGHLAALNDLAVLLLGTGRKEEAGGLLERALALKPDDPRARQSLEKLRTSPPGSR